MRKKIHINRVTIFYAVAIIIIVASVIISISKKGWGNRDFWDTNYTFDRAIIGLPNGESIEVQVDEWSDYDDGDQIQIKDKSGNVYLVHSSDCILINDKK